jgi:hypothetical protein
LFFVVFAMKFDGFLRRMRRDGWIKARCEEGLRMKPPHGGSGGVARGGGGGGAEAVWDFGRWGWRIFR